jgi:hypothetical protein
VPIIHLCRAGHVAWTVSRRRRWSWWEPLQGFYRPSLTNASQQYHACIYV